MTESRAAYPRVTTRITGLTGLRGLALLGVVLAHTWVNWTPRTVPAPVLQVMAGGLVLFFALSGLVITLPFLRAAAGETPPVDLRRYAARRLARIYPAYVVVFLLSDAAAAVYLGNAVTTGVPGTATGAGRMTDPGDLAANLLLVHSLFPATLQTGINPSWSLTAELCFYLVVPLLSALVLQRVARRPGRVLRRAAFLGVALLLLGWVTRLVAEHWWRASGLPSVVAEFGPHGVAVLSRSAAGVADNFGAGVLVAVLVVALEQGRFRSVSRASVLAGCGAMIVASAVLTHLVTGPHPWFVGSAIALAAAALLVLVAEPAARRRSSRIAALCDNQVCFHLGVVSYGAYLWHYPVILTLARIDSHVRLLGGDDATTAVIAPLLVLGGSVLLATLTWHAVEKPALAWAARQ